MKRIFSIIAAVTAVALLAGCGPAPAGETGTEVVSAAEALELLESTDNAVLVDTRATAGLP